MAEKQLWLATLGFTKGRMRKAYACKCGGRKVKELLEHALK